MGNNGYYRMAYVEKKGGKRYKLNLDNPLVMPFMALAGAAFLYTCWPETDASLDVKGNKVYVEINREGIDLSGVNAKGKVKNPKAYVEKRKG